jgi:DNA primase
VWFDELTTGGTIMPGVDFNRVRTEITMEQVLSLLGFQPSRRSGAQWYGSCPLHEPLSEHHVRRSFSVNVAIGRYSCHRCHSHGNQLELWAAATKLPLYKAAVDLCRRLGRDVPWIDRW